MVLKVEVGVKTFMLLQSKSKLQWISEVPQEQEDDELFFEAYDDMVNHT